MKRRRHTPEQIIRKLREADRLLAEGKEIAEIAKTLEVSEATYRPRRHRPHPPHPEPGLRFLHGCGLKAW